MMLSNGGVRYLWLEAIPALKKGQDKTSPTRFIVGPENCGH